MKESDAKVDKDFIPTNNFNIFLLFLCFLSILLVSLPVMTYCAAFASLAEIFALQEYALSLQCQMQMYKV